MTRAAQTAATAPLLGLDREGLAERCEGLGLKPFQVEEAYRWLYARRVTDPLKWTSLPKAAREALAARSASR